MFKCRIYIFFFFLVHTLSFDVDDEDDEENDDKEDDGDDDYENDYDDNNDVVVVSVVVATLVDNCQCKTCWSFFLLFYF